MAQLLYQMPLASTDTTMVTILIALAAGTALFILVASSLIGPKRVGKRKHETYESGMEPIGDTRRRFGVRFYLIAVLFLLFDVEILFLYPWAAMALGLHGGGTEAEQVWATQMANAGYTPVVLLGVVGIFFVLLLVGLVYEWRRGVFKWN